jgi:hypothetical protein
MLDEKKIHELKAAHGKDLTVIEVDGTQLVFRKPKRQEYDHWFDNRDKGSSAARELAQATLVYPDREAFIAALDAQPARLSGRNGILDAIVDLAGASDMVTPGKKL